VIEAERKILPLAETPHGRAKFSRRLTARVLTARARRYGLRGRSIASRPDPIKDGRIQIHDMPNMIEWGGAGKDADDD
jgi:hypothetical protein